jgi:prefoldin beta subunit
MELSDSQKNDLLEFQGLQQQMQSIGMQKQQFQFASAELERAADAVGAAAEGKIYRFSGSILVPAAADKLKAELSEEKEMLKIRLDAIAKAEEKLKARMLEIQKKFESKPPATGKK